MIVRLPVSAGSLFVLSCQGAEQKVLAGVLSPDKRVVIIEERDGPDRDYYFARTSEHEKLDGKDQ